MRRKIEPIQIETNRAWWNANVSGKDEDFAAKEAAENRLNEALANPEPFARLKKIHEGQIDDKVLKRTIEVLYLQYLEKQVDPALLKQDDRQGQRDREGVQRLPRQGRRQGDDRQRGPQGPQGVEGLGRGGRPSGRRASGWAPVSRTT